MRLGKIAIVCFNLLLLPLNSHALQNATSAGLSTPTGAEAARALLRDAFGKIQNNDFAGALDGLRLLIGSPGFALLSDQEHHAGYYLLGASELQAGDVNAALKMLRLSTGFSDSIGIEWHFRLIAAYQLGDYDDSIISLTTIAQKWPASLSQLNDQAIFIIARKASEETNAAAIALIEPLHQLHWSPQSRFRMPDRLWLELAEAYANIHDQVHEAAALEDVHDPGLLIAIRADKRFDAAMRANPAHYDFRAALDADLREARRLAKENPDRLEGVNTLADELIRLDRPAEALALLDDALDRVKSSPSAFSDASDQLNWSYNNRARSLTMLGRHQEALFQLEQAARTPEHDHPNVSQVINLADAYNAEGRPGDAIRAVSGLEMAKPSPYGMMALEHARGCGYAQLQDKSDLEKSLEYLKAHAADGRRPLLETFICANELDAAAKLIIAELQDQSSRGEILVTLQDYLLDPGATALDKRNRARLLAIRSRADVMGAISRVGRIESYPILPLGS